jgi:YVTN family beta-propeller protein
VLVGNTPQDAVFDQATRTVYVANQGDNTMSVANARTCNARVTAGCGRQASAFPAGSGPFGIGLDQATHTIYVADSNSDTVSVFNAATCNAAHTAGCQRMTATMKVGGGPAYIAVDPATDTVYVTITGTGISGAGDTVAVIDGATCNAANTSGCGHKPAAVPLGTAGFFIAFDATSQTVYVTDPITSKVSMINTRACRAGHAAGCGRTPPAVAAGTAPIPIAADPRTNTIYVGHLNQPTVTLINGATCNAIRTSGCGRSPGTLHVQGGSDGLVVNEVTRTLFVANNGPGNSTARSNSVSVVDAATCNAQDTSGCGQRAPAVRTGANPGGNTVDEQTNTLYVATFDDALQVINGATCTPRVLTGCGQTTPAAIAGPDDWAMAINPATHTAYVGDDGQIEGNPVTISVLNTATCNTTGRAGCTPHPPVIPMKSGPFGLAVDPGTDTLYAANTANANNTQPGHTVSVINGATCNATNTSGCATAPMAVTVGTAPAGEAVNQATHTLYVANSGSNTVSVINTAACNAKHTAGCGHSTSQVPLGHSPWSVAVNQATNTVYILNPGTHGTVSVIDGATCNATDTSGCGTAPPTVTVGNDSGSPAWPSTRPPTPSTRSTPATKPCRSSTGPPATPP